MRMIFFPLIAACILFSTIYAYTNEIHNFNPKNYVYDDEGNPVFIKIYIQSSTVNSPNQNKGRTHQEQDDLIQILNRMTQHDQRGGYVVVPIKKKKSHDDDDDDDKDESTWECPYCHRTNKASDNYCQTKDCVLHR